MPQPDSPNPPTATPGPAHEAPIGPSPSALELLPPGQALSLQQIAEITRGQYTPLVLLAGAVGSGKTTLLASLQDCFHRGTFADCRTRREMLRCPCRFRCDCSDNPPNASSDGSALLSL